MNRTICSLFSCASLSLTLALVGCGDDKGTTTTSDSAGSSSTADASTGGADTGEATSTGTVEPTTGTDDPNTTSTTGPNPTTVDPDPTTTTNDPSTTTNDPSTTTGMSTAPDTGDVDMCLMMVDPGDACGECACNNCLDELSACQDDEGCTAIRMCAQEAMCSGIACLGPCGETINKYGGVGGPSAMLALTLSGCVDMNCADEC